jgi:hypothetical protein
MTKIQLVALDKCVMIVVNMDCGWKGIKNDFIFWLIVHVLLFANTIQLICWLGYIYKIYPIFLILPFNVVNIVKTNAMWNEPIKRLKPKLILFLTTYLHI